MTDRLNIVDLKKYLPCNHCGVKGFKGNDNWCTRPSYYHLERSTMEPVRGLSGITTA